MLHIRRGYIRAGFEDDQPIEGASEMKIKTENRAEYRAAMQGDTDKTKDDVKPMPHGFMHRDLFNGQ